jgi:hypothetical protein
MEADANAGTHTMSGARYFSGPLAEHKGLASDLPACYDYIEQIPAWARENGYILSRQADKPSTSAS